MERLKIEYYKNFGRCVVLESGEFVAKVTVDIGPRIIYFGTKALNFLYEDIERNVTQKGAFFDEHFKKGEEWRLYGGHRAWKSPEDMWTYVPDNYPVAAEVLGGGEVLFVPKPSKQEFQFSLRVKFSGGTLLVENRVENIGENPQEIALWALTVMAAGGTLLIEQNKEETGFLPNKNLAFWPYNSLRDPRFYMGEELFALKQTSRKGAFKFGGYFDKLKAFYALSGKLMEIEYFEGSSIEDLLSGDPLKGKNDGGEMENLAMSLSKSYPDFGCNFESYTNEHILEIEGLTAVQKLEKNQAITFSQKWTVSDGFKSENMSEKEILKRINEK